MARTELNLRARRRIEDMLNTKAPIRKIAEVIGRHRSTVYRELNRVEVLSQVLHDRMTAQTAANVLGLSRRQVHRLLERFRSEGPAAIRHKARGRASNNRIDPGVREFAVTLVRKSFADFGPTLAAEKLEEDHGLKVSRETLRKWMQDAGIWLSRKQRRTFHQPRLRRECYGELIQIDGSDHRWFEE